MKILSHRGYWKEEKEKNTIDAVRKAFDHGFGIESDIRDLDGKLVISHNPADSACPMAEDVFELMRDNGDKYCFAINIKADGLKGMLGELLSKYQIDNYFTFDMSVPQMLEYRERESGIIPDRVNMRKSLYCTMTRQASGQMLLKMMNG